ncbi:hypothetical protein DPEC_G00246060 [Dallia pectoralis]|uniref:Uncharacterized protein n=1 Tax=Dallia pectoralis TaxID=75939 RepID=A0ACC2FWK5_DALPE|nr:hypothetical protein DPEC_G00246060 [Dallia pectoralis]
MQLVSRLALLPIVKHDLCMILALEREAVAASVAQRPRCLSAEDSIGSVNTLEIVVTHCIIPSAPSVLPNGQAGAGCSRYHMRQASCRPQHNSQQH